MLAHRCMCFRLAQANGHPRRTDVVLLQAEVVRMCVADTAACRLELKRSHGQSQPALRTVSSCISRKIATRLDHGGDDSTFYHVSKGLATRGNAEGAGALVGQLQLA